VTKFQSGADCGWISTRAAIARSMSKSSTNLNLNLVTPCSAAHAVLPGPMDMPPEIEGPRLLPSPFSNLWSCQAFAHVACLPAMRPKTAPCHQPDAAGVIVVVEPAEDFASCPDLGPIGSSDYPASRCERAEKPAPLCRNLTERETD
jgi:hypothetical protein